MSSRLFAAFALAFLLASCSSRPARRAHASPALPPEAGVAILERELLALVQEDRGRAGLLELVPDARLSAAARAHSRDMMAEGFFGHESPSAGDLAERLLAAGYVFREARENVALDADIRRAEAALLASPGHRANLLAAGVTHVGIGIAVGPGASGPRTLHITQIFARPLALDYLPSTGSASCRSRTQPKTVTGPKLSPHR
ncbi:MAG: CAP domain-containing protein [Planctomycetes bacterium]|nr:CAP domain-containing protein [Planctomycetota bacterium]